MRLGNGADNEPVDLDNEHRTQGQAALEASNRALKLLSRCNRALIHARDEGQLLETICQLAVNVGGYRMAWAGYALDDPDKSITPLTCAGAEDGYLTDNWVSWADHVPAGQGPAGRAIRSGRPVFVPDITTDAGYQPWLARAQERGYGGIVCLPLSDAQRTFGVLTLFKHDVDAFPEEEQRLLQDLADDLAYGIATRRIRRREAQLQNAVLNIAAAVSARSGVDFFQLLVDKTTEALGADYGYITRLLGDNTARTVAGRAHGEAAATNRFTLAGTPSERALEEGECIIADHVCDEFPGDRMLRDLGVRAYVGYRLTNSAGVPLGILSVMFRDPIQDTDFVVSTLKILAAGAASELVREESDKHIRQQALLLEQTRDAIILVDQDDRISYWNNGAEKTYGWPADEAMGRSGLALLNTDPTQHARAMQGLKRDGYWSGELVHTARDGTHLVVEAHWSMVDAASGGQPRTLQISSDITQRKLDQERIQQLAFYDSATALPNRTLFMDRLEQAVNHARTANERLAVLFLDLDRFKEINDSQGHAMGDRVLAEVARRFKASLREGETLARLGGDEFVVKAGNVGRDGGEAIAQRLHAALHAPLTIEDQTMNLDVSIGVAAFPDDGHTVEELLKHTDIAMYHAKASGTPYALYHADMSEKLGTRLTLYKRFLHALQTNVLQIHYQPQVDLRSGSILGAEALLRWHDAEWGWIGPNRFIPLAEERRLMNMLGDWVIRRVCQQIAAWRQQGTPLAGPVSVNIAAQQLETADLITTLLREVRSAGLTPADIALEITETGIMGDPAQAAAITQKLRDAGFSLSIDDFGTGYSSLAYLKRFPVETLKIDLSFVRDMLVDPNDLAIVHTIISMANGLGLTTLAEGVETREQADRLIELGCTRGQGFYFGRPMAAAALARSIHRDAPST